MGEFGMTQKLQGRLPPGDEFLIRAIRMEGANEIRRTALRLEHLPERDQRGMSRMRIGTAKRVATAAAVLGLAALPGVGTKALAVSLPPAGVVGTPQMMSGVMSGLGQRYVLHLHHLHTGESLDVVYRVGNFYLPDAMEKLNVFLRDHRTQAEADYDPKEFDLLHSLMASLGRGNGVVDIVCGYRSPESNEFLRTRSASTGVAEHSQHMLSKAIDIRVPGVSTLALRNAALAIGAGGVGYYPVSQFVHVDVGPVREWQYGGFRMARGRARRHVSRFQRGM